ncbi:thymidine phosphorylase family protein [Methylophaga sp.]|uniref:thymidine phosphorylase family protein n=1 Tax=Methylophaga sp. TaxID=2024840 RepID=UPI003A9338AF
MIDTSELPAAIPSLKLKCVAIDTYKENVAYLHRSCALYRSEGFQALSKIEIHTADNEQPVIAVLNVVDDTSITDVDELGLSEQVYEQLGIPEGSEVFINHASPPDSLKSVHKKIAGEKLDYEQYLHIIQDIVNNRYSKIETAAFIVGCAETGMERDEILHLTHAMVDTGERIDWGEGLVCDKHCIGGIPGNRTTMLLVPIIAAHGMLMPKTSSRAITSPAGTADTMEVLANVDLSLRRLHKIVSEQRAFLAWGGTAKLAPADDVLISVERPLSMDSTGQMIASILSKKMAAGATHLIIDIPIGPSAKVHTHMEALKLRKLFEYVGDNMGLHLEVVITDGSQPIGRGIGPVLETQDVMKILTNEPDAPIDLKEKALQLAGRIIEFDPDVRGGQGYTIARDILESGRALTKMNAIIDAQGRNNTPMQVGKLHYDICAQTTGTVSAIDNLKIASIARLAGAPMDKGAGVYLHKKVGDKVKQGEPLFTIYAEFNADFSFAKNAAMTDNSYQIEHL